MFNIGVSTIRIALWGILYYHYNKEPPIIVLVIIWSPILGAEAGASHHAPATTAEVRVTAHDAEFALGCLSYSEV